MTVNSRGAWLAIGLALSGCLNPATTRLPSCAPAPNAVERRSLGHYDPLPDRNLGPDTDSRPREFIEARDPQRQSQEGRLLQDAPAGPAPSGYSTGAYRDGDVVR
jgi:hypothetical protein